MTSYSVSGPFSTLHIGDDPAVPWYIITFDSAGGCTSPQARADLIAALRDGGYDQLILFSHGWNNVWSEVEELNRRLIAALDAVWRREDWARPPRLLVASIFWPSVAVLAEDEQGPDIAAAADEDLQGLESLTAGLPPAQAGRLRDLAAQGTLDPAAAAEFAALLAPLLGGDKEVKGKAPSSKQLLALARESAATASDGGEAIVDPGGDVWGEVGAGPEAAGTLNLSWRLPFRIGSIYAMKQRAGLVGARGVAPLLNELLAANPTTTLHLSGHSYGCRVMLSAISAGALVRKVASLLLLQPAVSRYCFATQVPTTGKRGGYYPALSRVRQPIMLTFSERDAALHKLFSLAMALARQVGEPDIAGPFDNIYAALGGYGPAGIDYDELAIKRPGEPYSLQVAQRIIALDGSRPVGDATQPAINGHGDITSPYTGWALYTQLLSAMGGGR